MHSAKRRSAALAVLVGLIASIGAGPVARAQEPSSSPSATHQADAELEALIPAAVGGQPLCVRSMISDELRATMGEESVALIDEYAAPGPELL